MICRTGQLSNKFSFFLPLKCFFFYFTWSNRVKSYLIYNSPETFQKTSLTIVACKLFFKNNFCLCIKYSIFMKTWTQAYNYIKDNDIKLPRPEYLIRSKIPVWYKKRFSFFFQCKLFIAFIFRKLSIYF